MKNLDLEDKRKSTKPKKYLALYIGKDRGSQYEWVLERNIPKLLHKAKGFGYGVKIYEGVCIASTVMNTMSPKISAAYEAYINNLKS